jgi:phage shock protein PspC (stress-responsive transcriptional regulator)
MKKIININLAGRVIPIEDAAYESLQRYIESLRQYFSNEEGRDEIINDIESRIAELMNEKIRKGATSITEEDMEGIISSMGRVKDFEEADASDTTTSSSAGTGYGAAAGAAPGPDYKSEKKAKRAKTRLYRDNTDKLLGGVCSGIANYLDMDPAMVRLLFAIITFGGFGFGFLLYIILWIILPIKNLDTFVGKRLFRNPDDKVIGGVAGGLAAYFGRNPQTIRIIFAAPLILNIFFSLINGIFSLWRFDYSPVDIAFGSITSTFILAYIVLWIVLPEARSPYEKMEMRGEKVDVNSIRQNVQENMNDFKSRATDFGDEVKDSAKRFSARAQEFANTRSKTFAAEAAPVARGIGHAIGVLFKAFFLFVAGSIAFFLFVALMILIFGGGTVLWPVKQALMEFVLAGFWQKAFFWGTMIFFLAVPLIAFITWLLRRIMKVRSQRHYLGWTFSGLWVIGIISLVGLITSLAQDFRAGEENEDLISVAQPSTGKMIVQVSQEEISYREDLFFVDDEDVNGWDFSDDSLKLGNIQVRVMTSMDSNYHVAVIRHSRGYSNKQAFNLASRIQYNVTSRDSILDLGSGFAINREDKYRGQYVQVNISVPVGKMIRFDETVYEKLHLRVHLGRRGRGREEHYHNFLQYRSNVDYIMQAGDRLVPADGSDDDNNRVGLETIIDTANANQDSLNRTQPLNRQQQIEEEQKRLRQEYEMKMRELERERKRTGYRQSTEKGTTAFRNSLPFFSILI